MLKLWLIITLVLLVGLALDDWFNNTHGGDTPLFA